MKIKCLMVVLFTALMLSFSASGQNARKLGKGLCMIAESDADINLRKEIRKSGGKDMFAYSIQLRDSLGNVIKETNPIFAFVSLNKFSTDEIICSICGEIGINGNRQITVCYDRNLNLKFIFPPEVQRAMSFNEGVSTVSAHPLFEHNFGFVDTTGTYIFRPEYDWVYRKNGKFYAISEDTSNEGYNICLWKVKTDVHSEEVVRNIYIPKDIREACMVHPWYLEWYQFTDDGEYKLSAMAALKDNNPGRNFHNGFSYLLAEDWEAAFKCFAEVMESDDVVLHECAKKNLEVVKAALESSMAE